MHARAFDRLEIGNRARQLGLERVLIAGAFHELTDAETRLLRHHGEATVAFGQSLRGQLEAGVVNVVGRNADRAAIELVRNVVGVERLRDLCGVLLAEVAVEQAVRRFLGPQHDHDAGRDSGCDADEECERPEARRDDRQARQCRRFGTHNLFT
jgi:hypothetical protein